MSFDFETKKDAFHISRRRFKNHHHKHVHDFFEILYLFAGERYFFINDRTVKMKEGDMILIHPNVLHRAASDESSDCEGILLYFHECFLASNRPINEVLAPLFESETVSLCLTMNERTLIEDLFLQMLQEMQGKNMGFELKLQASLLQLLVSVGRQVKDKIASPPPHPSPLHEKVSEIARYINQHFREPLSLDVLASRFYISPNYLSKVFKEATNFTFIEYLNNIRVKEAKRLLLESKKKVVEVAEEAGFGSVTHFGRVFKEVTGRAPLDYRKFGK